VTTSPLDAGQRDHDLVAFDVDGTLINSDDGRVVWQLLNERYDPELGNAKRFKAYMRKEITYPQWVDLDVGTWVEADARRDDIAAVITRHLRLVPGAAETIQALAGRGYRLAVISGTIDLTLELLLPEHPFEQVFTNKIWFHDDGRIAGWEATPFDMDGKADALISLARSMDIPLRRTVYVGDNFNDVQVMDAAGLAVAFEPKGPEVEQAADRVLWGDMRGLLEIL